jgi:hypothetical protein
VLFGLLAFSNFIKFVPVTDDTGFVLFGERLAGTANVVAGGVAGTILVAYAMGIWRLRRWALPLGWIYAAYVVVNSVCFRLRYPMPTATGQRIFELTYAVVAIATAVGTALLLTRRRDQLT